MTKKKNLNADVFEPLRRTRKRRITMRSNPETLPLIATAVLFNQPVLLKGESGTGKSTMVAELARMKGRECVRIDGSGNLTEDELLGSNTLVTGDSGNTEMAWVDGALTDAVRNGKWIIIEEINGIKPGVRLAMHSVLEDTGFITIPHTKEKVLKHSNFRLFATMNPPSVQYAGTQRDNFAFVDRFITIPVNYIEVDKETLLLADYFGYNSSYPEYDKIMGVLSQLCQFANRNRESYSTGEGAEYPITTRKLIQIVHHAHVLPITLVLKHFMTGLADKATANELLTTLTATISQGSEDDSIFVKYGKVMPTKDLASTIGKLQRGEHKEPLSEGDIVSHINANGRNIDYLKIAYHYTHAQVQDTAGISEFDDACILAAREIMEDRGYLDYSPNSEEE